MRSVVASLGLILLAAACDEKRELPPEYPHIDFAKVSHLQGRWSSGCIDLSVLGDTETSWEFYYEVTDDRWREGFLIYGDPHCQLPALSFVNISLVRDVGEGSDVRNLDIAQGEDVELTIHDNERAGEHVDPSLLTQLLQMGCSIPREGVPLSLRKDCKFTYDENGNMIPVKSWPRPEAADYFQIYQLSDANTLLLGLVEGCDSELEPGCAPLEGQDRDHRPKNIDTDIVYSKSVSTLAASENEIVTNLAPLKVLPLEMGSRLSERLRRHGLKFPFQNQR